MPSRFWRDEVVQSGLDHDVDAAIAEQQAILAKDPQNAGACFALGTLSQFQGDAEQAIRYFEQAIRIDAAHAPSHASLGRIYAVRGDYARAWEHARAAEKSGDRSVVELLDRYSCQPPSAREHPHP